MTTTTLPITTNIEAWHAVHDGLAAGMTRGEIAAMHDLSYQMVYNWSRMSQPPNRHLIGRTAGPRRRKPIQTCECGAAISGCDPRYPNTHCGACRYHIDTAPRRKHASTLLAWADEHGRVPTVNEATQLLGIVRSSAGTMVRHTFGPDTRNGHHRKISHRPWPPRATSDAIG